MNNEDLLLKEKAIANYYVSPTCVGILIESQSVLCESVSTSEKVEEIDGNW